MNVIVPRALIKVRTPNSLNKSRFAAAFKGAAEAEPKGKTPPKNPPTKGSAVKLFIRSLRFIKQYI
jgi:hypothetical protein